MAWTRVPQSQENYVSERIPGIANGALYQMEANRSVFKTNILKESSPKRKSLWFLDTFYIVGSRAENRKQAGRPCRPRGKHPLDSGRAQGGEWGCLKRMNFPKGRARGHGSNGQGVPA